MPPALSHTNTHAPRLMITCKTLAPTPRSRWLCGAHVCVCMCAFARSAVLLLSVETALLFLSLALLFITISSLLIGPGLFDEFFFLSCFAPSQSSPPPLLFLFFVTIPVFLIALFWLCFDDDDVT